MSCSAATHGLYQGADASESCMSANNNTAFVSCQILSAVQQKRDCGLLLHQNRQTNIKVKNDIS